MPHKIHKLGRGQFRLSAQSTSIILNFNPILKKIKELGLKNDQFCIIHFQAKPKGIRTWGIYDYQTDSYQNFMGDLKIEGHLVSIPETENTQISPTSVIVVEQSVKSLLKNYA